MEAPAPPVPDAAPTASRIMLFSALVPSVLATSIPVSVGRVVMLWFERVVLTILITAPLAHLLLQGGVASKHAPGGADDGCTG